MKSIVVLSGGMDSTTLLYKTISEGYKPYVLSFNYGQRHKKELEYAKRTTEKLGLNHKIVDVSSINELIQGSALTSDIDVPEGHYADPNMKLTVVPNRNMIMLSLAIAYAISKGAKTVFYGAHAGDHDIYPDCRKEFVDAMKKVAKLCDYEQIDIQAPFLDIDKGDILTIGQALKVDYSLTWTCYKGLEKACGKCGSCVERLEGFENAGMVDPIEYENN